MILALASVVNCDRNLALQIVASLTIIKVTIVIVLKYRPQVGEAGGWQEGGVARDGNTKRYLPMTRGRYFIVYLPIRATERKAAGQNLGSFSQTLFEVNLGTIF
jgi:hypothetical protein